MYVIIGVMARTAHSYRVHSAPDAGEGWQPCAQGRWCASATFHRDEDGDLVAEAARGPRPFCDADAGRIRSDLEQLPGQYVHLSVEMRRPAPRKGTPVRVPAGSKVLIRLDCEALMRLMAEILVSWHQRVAFAASLYFPDEAGGDDEEVPRHRRDGTTVSDAVKALKERVPVLLSLQPEPVRRAVDLRDVADLPDDTPGIVHAVYAETALDMGGKAAGLEILRLRYLCRAILGETRDRPEELFGVPCRGCDMLSLRRAELPSDPEVPGQWSECTELECGDMMTWEEYRDWTRLYATWAQQQERPVVTLENLPGAA